MQFNYLNLLINLINLELFKNYCCLINKKNPARGLFKSPFRVNYYSLFSSHFYYFLVKRCKVHYKTLLKNAFVRVSCGFSNNSSGTFSSTIGILKITCYSETSFLTVKHLFNKFQRRLISLKKVILMNSRVYSNLQGLHQTQEFRKSYVFPQHRTRFHLEDKDLRLPAP